MIGFFVKCYTELKWINVILKCNIFITYNYWKSFRRYSRHLFKVTNTRAKFVDAVIVFLMKCVDKLYHKKDM